MPTDVRGPHERLSSEALAAIALLTRLGIRADRVTAEIVARVLAAEREARDPITTITYGQAEHVGQRLCSQWHALVGTGRRPTGETFWADVVQFVLREARAQSNR